MRTSSGHYIGFGYDNPACPKQTTCFIKGSDKNVVAEATVTRYHKDKCNKAASRKFALAKALSKAGFNKEQRTLFWNTFVTNVKLA